MRLPNWLRGWAARLRVTTARRVVSKHKRGGVTTVQTAPSFHLHFAPMARPRQRAKAAPGPRIPSVAEVRLRNRREDARHAQADAVRDSNVQAAQAAPSLDAMAAWRGVLTSWQAMGKLPPRLTFPAIRAALATDPALQAHYRDFFQTEPPQGPTGPARRPAITERLTPTHANTRPVRYAQPVAVKASRAPDGTIIRKAHHRALPGQGGK